MRWSRIVGSIPPYCLAAPDAAGVPGRAPVAAVLGAVCEDVKKVVMVQLPVTVVLGLTG